MVTKTKIRMMTPKEIKEKIERFKTNTENNGMYLIRETSNAYKCDRFLWQWSPIVGSGRSHTVANKDYQGTIQLYGDYK